MIEKRQSMTETSPSKRFGYGCPMMPRRIKGPATKHVEERNGILFGVKKIEGEREIKYYLTLILLLEEQERKAKHHDKTGPKGTYNRWSRKLISHTNKTLAWSPLDFLLIAYSGEVKFEAMVSSLPKEIVHDILLRLPPKALIRCTSVCKPWNSMVKNPSFIRTHLSRTINLNNQFGTHLLLLHCVRGDNPVEQNYYLHYDNPGFDEYIKLEFPIVPKRNKFLRVVGISNGLVFLADDRLHLGYTFIIFNPSIRKSVTLPEPHLTFDTIGPYSALVGFGFDAVTNDYKVVRLLTDQCEDPNTFYEVYSLARGLWSSPRSFDPVCEVFDSRKFQAFVNGAVHWQAWRRLNDGRYQNFILAFDVNSEVFREIKVPKSFRQDKPLDYHLSVSGDGNSIAMFTMRRGRNCTEDFLDIWVMKEYGIEDSWTKLKTLSPPDPERRVLYKPLCFRKSGEVVLVSTDDYGSMHELVSLDLVSKQFKNLGIRGYGYYYAEPYEESLVLLDNADAVSYRGKDQLENDEADNFQISDDAIIMNVLNLLLSHRLP